MTLVTENLITVNLYQFNRNNLCGLTNWIFCVTLNVLFGEQVKARGGSSLDKRGIRPFLHYTDSPKFSNLCAHFWQTEQEDEICQIFGSCRVKFFRSTEFLVKYVCFCIVEIHIVKKCPRTCGNVPVWYV